MAGIDLEFVTPVWTGDASRNARRVVGTGLVGSLRWWYEALVRGLGGWACDPTDDGIRCPPRGAAVSPDSVLLSLCPACQLFGATGWAKSFSMGISDGTAPGYPPTGRERQTTTGRRLNQKGDPSAWYFPQGRIGSVRLAIDSRRPDDTRTVRMLLGLLDLIRRNAALGAKTNLGYGLFQWEHPPEAMPSAEEFVGMLTCRAQAGRRGEAHRWPDVREMFFSEVVLQRAWQPADFANFKCGLRAAFREGEVISSIVPDEHDRRQLRHFLLGTTEDDPHQASKIKMALLPDHQKLRLWGWVPNDLPGGAEREKVVQLLHQRAESQGTLVCWREFDSTTRDTIGHFTNPAAFLHSLMEG